MASIYDLKPRFQALLRPLMMMLAGLRFTPNVITLLALAGSAGVGAAIALTPGRPIVLLLLPVWLFARMALNAIDGMMAREMHMATHVGAVLNELGDVLSDLCLYLPLAWLSPTASLPIIAFSIGAALTEFCGVLARALGASRRYDGPMGKSDRAFVIGALAILTVAAPAVRELWTWIFIALALLTALTCSQRLARALVELRAKG